MGGATRGVTIQPNAICTWARKMRPQPHHRPGWRTPQRAGSEDRGPAKQDIGLSLCGDHGTGHSPEFKQQRLLQAQQGCAHREEEDGGTKEDMLWAVAAPQRKRSSGEQEETKAHQPLERKKGRLVPGTELAIV